MLVDKDGRFTLECRVGTQGSIGINEHVQSGAVSGMFNVTNGLKNINDCFNHASFFQQHFFMQQYQFVFHIGADSRDELQSLRIQLLKARLTDKASVSAKASPESPLNNLLSVEVALSATLPGVRKACTISPTPLTTRNSLKP